MNTIVLNSQEKAERIIDAGRRTHRMDWCKTYRHDGNWEIKTQYIIFYSQKEAK